MEESEEELKSLLMTVKEESPRASLKLNNKKTKIMASAPTTAWQIEEEKVEVVTDFLFLGSKITAGRDCSHEIRRWLLLGRKAITNLDIVLKSRDITLLTKVHIYRQGYSLPSGHIQLWEMDHKQGKYQRIDAFDLWCWRRLLEVPWTAKR